MQDTAQTLKFAGEEEIPSPALLIHRERLAENLSLMVKIAGSPERLRPHVKTHKMAAVLAMQVQLGIHHYKCSTLAEVAMCAQNGARDVLLAMPPTAPTAAGLKEIAAQHPAVKFAITVDHPEHLALLRGTGLSFFLDVDCGMGRTGIAPGPAALSLIAAGVAQGLSFRGVHAYDGHIHDADLATRKERCEQAMRPVLALRQSLEAAGYAVGELVAGGSPTFGIHAQHPDRRLSPGTTVLWDTGYGDKFPDLPFHHAALLLTRVISKPSTDRLTLDLGHKAVAPENPHPRLRLLEEPETEFVMQSEEHLVISVPLRDRYSIGEAFHAIPRHVCPSVSMYGAAYFVSEDSPPERVAVTARDRWLGESSQSPDWHAEVLLQRAKVAARGNEVFWPLDKVREELLGSSHERERQTDHNLKRH